MIMPHIHTAMRMDIYEHTHRNMNTSKDMHSDTCDHAGKTHVQTQVTYECTHEQKEHIRTCGQIHIVHTQRHEHVSDTCAGTHVNTQAWTQPRVHTAPSGQTRSRWTAQETSSKYFGLSEAQTAAPGTFPARAQPAGLFKEMKSVCF